ncbi:MAG: ATP-binding cassette domain-containing protein, partial [bacterium]
MMFARPEQDRGLVMGAGSGPLVSLRNVEKSYPAAGSVHYVLRRVTLDIASGDFVTIMGPSGAGKSTLLAILGMLDPVFTGEFHFHGHA